MINDECFGFRGGSARPVEQGNGGLPTAEAVDAVHAKLIAALDDVEALVVSIEDALEDAKQPAAIVRTKSHMLVWNEQQLVLLKNGTESRPVLKCSIGERIEVLKALPELIAEVGRV